MARVLRAFLIVFGVIDVLIALLHLVLGPASIPGSVPVNATMDSEDRFYATLFLGFGAACVACARDVAKRGDVVRFLAATFFLGGLARLVSMAVAGVPHAFFVAMTPLELGIPVFLWLAVKRVERDAAAA